MGKVLTTILPQADYTADVATDNSYAWIENYEHPENAALDEMGLFVVGKKYIVSFNGVEYECEAFLYANSQPSDTGDPVGIGNPYVYRTIGNGWPTVDGEPEDNGIPFFITTHDVDGEVWGQVYTTEASTPINVGISRVDEAPSKLPEKFLPDFAMGGTSAPSDWNASEGEAGHIKNRTHWVESGGAAILEETSLPGGDGQFMLEGDITLEDGKTYRIVYNGTEYMCTAVDGATLDPEMPYGQEILFGNYGAMTGAGDTGEPFFGSNVPSMGLMVMDLSGASSCNMGIYDDSEIVHKLDNKFIDAEWMATSKVNKVPVLEEAEYSVTETGAGNSDMGRYAMLSEFSLEGGKKYIVDLDGKSYECTCGVLFEQEITCCYLGNMAFSGAERTNTGEPFCIFIMQELNAYYFFAAEGTHTMGLYKAEEVANKLPEKFLPEMPVIVPVKSIDYETFAVTMSYTGEEVRALLMENKIVFASVMGMTFIATGALVETNEGLKAEFASVLDPTIKARLGPNGEFTVVEE